MQDNRQQKGITRRESLKRASALMILPAGLARGYTANTKLDIGVIGLGRGKSDATALNALGENIAALCDVDSARLEKLGADYPKARRYTDFRQMIAKEKHLDAVVVATPDHTHAYISVLAMKQGLHVYCEKPLAQNVHEARVMARVAAETKVITQMGTASSAEARNLRTAELIQSGALGEITEIHLATDRPIWPQGYRRVPGEDPVPSALEWDLWLGTAPTRPFQARWPGDHPVYKPENARVKGPGSVYHPFSWRGWIEFGSGALGDIAPHSMNVVFFTLDLGEPSAVEVVETSGMTPDMYPEWSVLRFDYAARGIHPPLSIYWYDGNRGLPTSLRAPEPATRPATAPGSQQPLQAGQGGLVWIGTKGSLPQGRGPFSGRNTDPYETPPVRDWGREDVYKDWVAAVKTGKQAPCNFGYAGPFTEAYQLGNVALRVGHRIEWDPLAFRITNCREANQYLSREYRRGWDLKEIAGSAYDEPKRKL